MAIRVKVVPASESISSDTAATTVRNDVVTLQQSSNVALDIDPDQVAGYVKDGQDLVVQLKTGENVRIVNFYAEGQSPSHLFLVDDKKLVAVDLPVVASDGPLAASYLPQETLAGFDSLTAAGAGAGSGISGAMVLGGLAAVGAAVALADSGGGGGGGSANPPQNPPVPDTTPPAAPTGLAFSADGRTLTGSGEVGATVRVDTNGDGQPDATGTVGADGRFSVTLSPPLTNGESVSVTLVDAAGNVSGPGQATAPDTTPPAAASNVVVADDGSSISGSGEPGATVGVDTDGDGQPDATVVIGGDGQFTVPLDPPLTEGETISVVVTDPAGNSSPPVTVQAPDYPDAPLVNASNGSVISGTAGAGLTILLTDGDGNPIGQTVADASGNWSFTPPAALADGTVVTAVAQNAAGNTSPATSITIDGVAPAAPVIDPSNGTTISGTAEAGSTVTLTDGNGNPIGQVTADGDGHWSFTPGTPLPDGTVVNATATDPAGNTSGQGSITVDAVAPSTPTVEPSNGGTLTGTAEPGSTVVLTDGNGNPIAEVAVDGSGNWSYTPGTPLPDGTVVTVVAQDASGNSSPPATVTVDSQPPAAPILEASNGTTLSGTAEPGSTVTLTDGNGNPIGQVTADGNGDWSFTPATPLPNGTVVNASATDATGNTGPGASIIVDAVAPAAPVVLPSNGTSISGTAEPGSTVTLTDGSGTAIGQTTTDGNGNWSFTPATPLPDGTVINATATDAAGNTGGQGGTTVDAVPPAAPVLNLSNGSAVTGTAEPGSRVILTDGNGDPIASVTVDGSGNWSYTPATPLPNGTVVNAVAVDGSGNASVGSSITIDSQAPSAPVLDVSNGTLIVGTAEPGSTVTLTDGNGNLIAQVTADGFGDWTFTPATPLPDGTVINATATDATGNTSAPSSITVDAVAPAAPVVNPSNGITLTGTAEPGSVVTLIDGSGNPFGQAPVDSNGNWSFPLATPLPDGSVVSATATDASGNTSGATSITVDALPPATPVLNPSNGNTVSGTAEPNSTIILTDGNGDLIAEVTVDGSGNWSYTPATPLPDGTVVTAVAVDAAGNTSPPSTVSVDASAPPAPVIDPSNGTTVSGTAEAGSTVILTDGSGNPIGQVTADGSGNWSFTPGTPLPDGTVIVATATDATGNTGPQAAITVDALPPPAPVVDPSNGTTITGTAEAGATVILTDGSGNPIGQTTADGSGNWSFTPATALPDGTVVNAVAQDAAGNTGPQGSTTVDAVAPPTPVVNASNGNVLTGTAEPNSTVTLTDGDGNPIGQATVDGSGNWSFSPATPLPDGTVVNVTATDAAGNTSAPASTTVDSSLPSIPLIDPSNGSVISGTADPGNTVIITDGSGNPIGQVTADGSGNWSFTPGVPLPDGTVVNVIARSPSGVDSAPAAITIDGVAPPAPVIDPSNGVEISGTAEANAVIVLTDGSGTPIGQTTADGSGNWSFTPATPLPDGTVVNAIATDPAGNSSGPASITVDAVAPPAPVINASNGVVISGTAEAGAIVILTDGNGNPIGQTTADGSGNWSFTPATALPDGTVVNAIATDPAGNSSGPATTTVDAVAPPAPVIDASNGSIISGTAEAGATVILTDGNGNPIGQTTADGSGNWSFTPGAPLPDGTVINAVAQDVAGNSSGSASTTVDAVAPPAPVINASNGAVISGTAEAGATVVLTDGNGDPIGQTTADGSGNWSFTPGTPLPDGTVITAVAQDAAGNASGPATTTVDTVAPPAPVLDPSNGSVVSGTAEAGATVILTDGSGNPIGQTTADGAGNWSYTPATPLPNGTVITAVAQDAAGNGSGPASTTVDSVAPPAPTIDASNGSVISGTAEAGATVILTDGNGIPIGQTIADGSGNWSFTPGTPLPDGTVINALARDAAGNNSSPVSTTVDAVAPSAPTLDASNGTVITGTVEPGVKVILTDGNGDPIGEAIADGSGNWSFTPATPLPDGTVINAIAQDAAGNNSGPVTTTVDAVAPPAPVIDPSNGSVISGTAEAGATVILTDGNGDPIGQAIADGSGNWSFTPGAPLPDGTVINAIAQDAAGNTSGPGTTTVDAVAPPAPVIDPSNGSVISGTAEAGATVILTDGNGDPIGQAIADGSGTWSFTPGAPLPDGTVINAVAQDAAGNTSGPATTTVDAVAPPAPVIDPSNGSVISGTAEAGATVILTDGNGDPIGETTADGSGNWSFTPGAPLPDGTVISAIAQDAAGNTSGPATTTVDAVAPPAPVIDPSNGSGITGTAEAGATVILTDGNGDPIGETTADGSGNWSFTPGAPLPDGTVINAIAQDAAGNTSGPATTTVDAVAPPAPVIDPSNGSVIAGTAEAGATVILTDGSGNPIGQAIADGSGNWSFTPGAPLPDGTVINAVAQDAAGNSSGPATTTVDAVAPPAPVIDPSNGSVITGTAEAGATVILTDGNGDPIGQAIADGSGNWSFTPGAPLPDGTVINAVAQDPAGNSSGPTTTTVDAVAPPAPVIDPSNGSVITGTAEAGATVILTDGNGDPIGETTADGSGNWSFTPGAPLPDGTVINAVAQDAAGNNSGPATTTVDAVAPPAPLLSVSADGTLLSGTAEPNSQVRIVVNGDTANPITVNVDGSGNFSLPFAPPLIAGELISAVAIDLAGNTSGPATINAPDLAPPDISVPEAADTWINAAEIGDGIQVDVTVRPTMQVGQVITVRFAGQNGYEADVSHTLTAADIAAGSVTVTLTPPAGMGPFPEGASTITAEVAGGTASAPEAFTIDTVPPATPVLSLVGNLLTISAEPGTELTVTLTVGGVTATATVTADNSGLASLNLLTDLDIDFTWDQLLNAQVSVVGSDPAGNPSNVASIGTSIEQPVTIGNFGVDVSLNPLSPRFGFSGTTEPDSSVVIRVITPALNVELLPIQADSSGNFSLNLLSPTILSQLGLNITDILNLGSQISFNLVSTDSNGNDSAAYGVTLSPNGLSLNIGQIDVNGTSGNDVLSGANGSSEHINGGDGSDLIFNVGSGDHVVAGNGDDAIQITATNFVSIDGGAGFDTLILANGIDLDYNSAGVGTLSNIERIDLGTGDSGSVLTLTAAEVAAITDGNDTLQITGESNDVLNVIGAVNTGTTQLINGVTYDVYTFGSTTLLVEDNSVQVVA
ncbi:TPA: BapA prefix-like domain-containing protein [Stenotrophomonas maltophilia]|nr:BapA prefix-like domain-containing protein [Stenotrophomonas maltophilia]HEL4288548.1 BapA prefix-like domain-containing protein [Stenotrophomonas maltophilia]